MVENKSSIFGIIALLIGTFGLGVGVFSVVNFQIVEGPPGQDGQDAPGGILIAILDPDHGEIVAGEKTIRILVTGSESYTISILRNGTEIGNSVQLEWDTSTVSDGWWNITVTVTDITTNDQSQDKVMVYVQNVESSTNVYYCSSQSEIEDALDIIGTGHGTIIITEDITLNSQININGGGNYIIQGEGPVTLNRNANDESFSITKVQSLILKDLIIDTSNISSSSMQGINVTEENDNPVYIQNVQIHGGNGRGIFVNSHNVWIENSIIHDVRVGIYLGNGSAYCHILDNLLYEMSPSSGSAYGFYNDYSHFNTISGNEVYAINTSSGLAYGIYLAGGSSNTISGNIVYSIYSNSGSAAGMWLVDGSSNTISGNTVYSIYSSIGSAAGIILSVYSSNIISGNTVNGISSSNSYAWGILLAGNSSNSISGNTINGISSSNSIAYGINLLSTNYNTVTDNVISNTQAPTRLGIDLTGADNNVIVGNSLYNTGTGISNSGSGNVLANNVVY